MGQTETPRREEWGFVFLQIYPPAHTKMKITPNGANFKLSQRLSIFLVGHLALLGFTFAAYSLPLIMCYNFGFIGFVSAYEAVAKLGQPSLPL